MLSTSEMALVISLFSWSQQNNWALDQLRDETHVLLYLVAQARMKWGAPSSLVSGDRDHQDSQFSVSVPPIWLPSIHNLSFCGPHHAGACFWGCTPLFFFFLSFMLCFLYLSSWSLVCVFSFFVFFSFVFFFLFLGCWRYCLLWACVSFSNLVGLK